METQEEPCSGQPAVPRPNTPMLGLGRFLCRLFFCLLWEVWEGREGLARWEDFPLGCVSACRALDWLSGVSGEAR
jgi:hypothetical protein